MLLSLNNLFNNEGEALCFDHSLLLQDYELNGNCPFQTPVSIKGKVTNNVGMVTLRAEALFTYHGACDRCTEPFEQEYKIPIQHSLVTHLNDDQNDDYLVVENGVLDLDELVLTDILLFLPSKMLCQEECQGLCPVCGQNLNQNRCDCKKPVDPRLAALMQLLDE